MTSPKDKNYQENIKQEAAHWDKSAKQDLEKFPPDYLYYKETLPYKIYRHKYVIKMLSNIQRGDKVLELGCYNGWFSLEMARKGAIVDAHDISAKAISIARKYYFQRKNTEKLLGKIIFQVTDLNHANFPENAYDIVVIRNVLHHLTNLKSLLYKLNRSLKDKGEILVDDSMPCSKLGAFVTGILLFLLPTDIPYSQKFERVFRKKHILKRTQGLVDACGASPFEGVSGKESVIYLTKFFKNSYIITFAAFIGTITSHMKMNQPLKDKVLKMLNLIDISLIKIGIFKGTSYYLESKKS